MMSISSSSFLLTTGYRSELHLGGLIHLRNRDDDPAVGQFTTRDELDGIDGTPTTANPYHYTDNDPHNRTDPLGLRPNESACSAFSPAAVSIDIRTCESALLLWERRDRSAEDCGAVGGVTYGSGTCYVPPRSGQQKDFCFPSAAADGSVVSLGTNGQCGVWSMETRCKRLSNAATDWICRHRVGILKVTGYVTVAASIVSAPFILLLAAS